jgi:hypothetical protein
LPEVLLPQLCAKVLSFLTKAIVFQILFVTLPQKQKQPMNDLTQSDRQNIIIYRTADGRASVALYAKDGKIWLNQQQMAELFATSKPNISMHIANILKENELDRLSVVKNYLTTAADGSNYGIVFHSL